MSVPWTVEIGDEFHSEFLSLASAVQVDTLKGSSHANRKELRLSAGGGEWRVAFAFDLKRSAILLVAGDKSGVGEMRFY